MHILPDHSGSFRRFIPPASFLIAVGCAVRQPSAPPRSLDSVPLTEKIMPSKSVTCGKVVGSRHLRDVYRIPDAASGCQQNMSRVQSFCIDRYEAHLVQEKDGRQYPFNRPVLGAPATARSAPGLFPQGHINQIEAEDACRRARKRLCTKAEWQAACMGLGQTTYPYGNEKIRGACNSERIHPPSELFGLSYQSHLNDPELNLFPGGLAKSGAHPRCMSDYGVFDMVGNLHEWVSDIIFVKGQQRGIFLGGFYSNDHENGYGCNYMTAAHFPQHFDYSTGFRCCADPM